MNIKDVVFSRGMFFLIALLLLVDALLVFVAKGFISVYAMLILEGIFVFYYVVARSIMEVDSRVWFLKKSINK